MITSTKFLKIIRQKVIPQHKKKDNSIIVVSKEVEDKSEEQEEEEEEVEQEEVEQEEKEKEIVIVREENKGTRYVGIDNTDLEQRVQHTIRNLMELDNEELAFIEDMNCRNMFEIVLLLNKVIATLVENMMAMN